MFNLWFFC